MGFVTLEFEISKSWEIFLISASVLARLDVSFVFQILVLGEFLADPDLSSLPILDF